MKKVLIVTGGSRGIGAATARLAAAAGYAVGISYVRNEPAASAIAREIVDAGGKALAVAADVANEADILRLFARRSRTGDAHGAGQ
ncbi:MAG TPA: SDR family NAD(P)-dependent oxidoreductase [Noviherbaspirillum sp.]|nr:SDR family NAD(P)-dependent oxidoreductase [Noviherbaspirillum sp.]